ISSPSLTSIHRFPIPNPNSSISLYFSFLFSSYHVRVLGKSPPNSSRKKISCCGYSYTRASFAHFLSHLSVIVCVTRGTNCVMWLLFSLDLFIEISDLFYFVWFVDFTL
ncbi:hypothetical protein VIGAN_08117000, partial [Vigna angularis var. angularis]